MSEPTESAILRQMTNDEFDAYVHLVIEHGKERLKNFGEQFAEDDYLMGASVLFEATGQFGKIPCGWVFGIMSGNMPISGPRESTEIRCDYWRGDERCSETEQVERRSEVPVGWIGVSGIYDRPDYLLRFCSLSHARGTLFTYDLEDA